MQRVAAVTGSKGFIGSHLTHALQSEGWEVRAIDLPEFDITDTKKLAPAFKGVGVVFHLAALPSIQYSIENPQESNAVNLGGTVSVLEAAREAHVERVIFSSSSAVYGDQETMPIGEDALAQPKSPYGLQKYAGELYCELFAGLYDLSTVCLRYFNVYGPGARAEGTYSPAIAVFLKQRAKGAPLTVTGDGTQARDFVHVSDVVRANILAALSFNVGKGEVLNIASGKAFSINQIAELVGGPVEHIAPRIEPRSSLGDITRAKRLLGWEPTVLLEAGIEELKKIAGLI